MSKKYSKRDARRIHLEKFDFSEIDKLDPSLNNEHQKIVFNQPIEFQIKFIEPGNEVHQLGAPEPVNVRMFCCINEEDDEYFRIELTSDNDVFFFYAHIADQESYEVIRADQRLSCEFENYPNFCVKMMREASNPESGFWSEFTIHHDGSSRLEIKRKINIKTVTLLAIDFSPMPDNMVKESITFRFGAMSTKIAMMEARVMDVYSILNKKNPSLLLKIQNEVE